MSLFTFDKSFKRAGYRAIAGIDESGRGCLAGPVVAACVSFKNDVFIEGITDSKKLTQEERQRLFEEILKDAYVGTGIVNAELIDRINIFQATRLAMLKAFENLGREVDLLLIDAMKLPQLKIKQNSIVKGDKKSASIASASIVAKVIRDRIMKHYHEIYSQYGFDKHKGYATKEHLSALKKFGPSPIHRKSFCPVRIIS